jgi:hypothetical protein
MKFFNLDLHISVIQDVKFILNHLFGPAVEITNYSISGHNWVFGATTPDVKIINAATWHGIGPEMIAAFQTTYDEFLRGFDGFIVTHTPVFALLYEKYGKPIIMVNSCRYEQPFSWRGDNGGWEWVGAGLRRMADRGQLICVSNNRADRDYLRAGTGVESLHIPSLCLYTRTTYAPSRPEWVCHGDRGFFPPSPRLVEKPKNGYSWSDLYSYAGIVHIPYEMSTMSLFEQYSAGVPLFLPSKQYYRSAILAGKMPFGSVYGREGAPAALVPVLHDLDFWLDRADFYDANNFRFVYFYDSPEDLIAKLEAFKEYDARAKEREAWIATRRLLVLQAWHDLFMSHAALKRVCELKHAT